MVRKVIVLSGAICSGKSTLSEAIHNKYGYSKLSTGDLISALAPDIPRERAELQKAGERLDSETKGKWVAKSFAHFAEANPSLAEFTVIDSIRTVDQIEGLRDAYAMRVIHVHLDAGDHELRRRYDTRSRHIDEKLSYDEARENATESRVRELANVADIVVDTGRSTPEDVIVRVASRLGLYARGLDRLVDVLIGGQYGSEGKGHVSSHLAPEYDVLVRVGGPNAGHKVFEQPEPRTFHHLPSGTTRNPAALVLLGPGAVIYPPKLLEEIAQSDLDTDRLVIDANAMVIEDFDREFEMELVKQIGSTGQGVGSATSRKILRTRAEPKVRLARDHEDLKPYVGETLERLELAYSRHQKIFLEGTQGTGLSLHHGSYPHVTSRDTSVSGCLAEAGIAPSRVRRIILVCRTYPIRVESPQKETAGPKGSGPMGIEIGWDIVSERSGIPQHVLENREKTSTTGKNRRVAEFDWQLLRKSVSLNGPTDIALTFADYISTKNGEARRFEQLTPETIRFVEEVEIVTSAPVSLISTGFNFRSIIDRRSWD